MAGCALPGALIVWFGFNGGGFGPAAVALAGVVLALGLAAHTTVADTPFSGASPALLWGAGALALFAAWTAASGWWSHAEARALIEANRALLYVLLIVAVATIAGRPWRVSWMVRGILLAIAVVSVAGLATRLYPDHFSYQDVQPGRANYPVGYWNTLGLIAGMGLVLALHLAAARDERQWISVPAAAVTPLLAATGYFTLSRGAIGATVVGLMVYLVLARTRLALLSLLAVAPGVALALVHSYDADLLTSDKVTTPAAAAQGHDLVPWMIGAVLLAAALRAAVIPLVGRIDGVRPSRPVALGLRAGAAALLVGAVVTALALHAPHELRGQYHHFVRGDSPAVTNNDQRTRLTSFGNTGRTQQWEASFAEFRSDRLKGGGAGTYDPWWHAHRPNAGSVRDAHSLYFEVIGELGIVGIALLAAALLALAFGTLRAALRLGNPVYAAAVAVFAMWLVRAGVDWDWEMPVVTVPALALAAAGAAGLQARGVPPLSDLARILIGIGWLAIALTPALIYVSQGRLDTSVDRYYRSDFVGARDKAESSLSALGARAQPYEVIGYSELHRNQPAAAVAAMRSAIKRDPDNWRFHYGLALAQMAAGADALPEARRASALERFGTLPPQLLHALNRTPRPLWPNLVRRYRRAYEGSFPGVGAT